MGERYGSGGQAAQNLSEAAVKFAEASVMDEQDTRPIAKEVVSTPIPEVVEPSVELPADGSSTSEAPAIKGDGQVVTLDQARQEQYVGDKPLTLEQTLLYNLLASY